MILLLETEKRLVGFAVKRNRGSGVIALTNPERRILNADRAVLKNWGAATWDEDNSEITTLFDSTDADLDDPGLYFVQLRGDIGTEQYKGEIRVILKEVGP